jgi:hypothetical protein
MAGRSTLTSCSNSVTDERAATDTLVDHLDGFQTCVLDHVNQRIVEHDVHDVSPWLVRLCNTRRNGCPGVDSALQTSAVQVGRSGRLSSDLTAGTPCC